MPTYTFFPHLKGGACLTFTAQGLEDDAAAMGHAALVLVEHPSAREVVVWEGERRVGSHSRSAAGDRSAGRSGRILVVEDSYFQAEDLRIAFHDAGFSNVSCSGGEDGAIASLAGDPPDLVILDIDLGDGPTFKLAEALDARGVPFLFFTAYDRWALPSRWRGVAHFLKPVSGREVVRAAQAILEAHPH